MKALNLILSLTAVALLAAGCASTGYDSGTKTATNIQKAANKITALNTSVDTALNSLNDLVGNPKPDLRPQYKTFTSELKKLLANAQDLNKARMSVGQQGKDFFAKWDAELAQIHNEDIKARSQARKAEVSEKLQAIKRSYAEAETAFKPFLADLQDVDKYLSVDLTTGGVNAIRDVVVKATQHAVPLKQSLGKLASDFQSLGVSMSAVTPAPAKK
jgi:chromosome segregation ATPase